MTEVAEKKHAVLSPSGAHRWAACPGSVVLEEGKPNHSSSYARWGTCAHEVAGIILETAIAGQGEYARWDPADAEGFIGRVFQIEGHAVEFDHEMADCVNDYVAHVESFWEPGDVLIAEQPVPLDHLTGETDATGTSDCIILKSARREIVVIDLKGGKGVVVDAEDNLQGLMYASGAAREHDLMYGPFETVRIVIVQPRCHHVSEWAVQWDEFQDRCRDLEMAAHQVRLCQKDMADGVAWGDTGYLFPGEKQCRFCKAKATCPELRGEVSAALAFTAPPARADEFPDLSIPKQAAAANPAKMSEVDADLLAEAWKSLDLVAQWADAVRAEVHSRLHDGAPVGNLTLYEGRQGARAWSNAAAAEQRMRKARVKVDAMFEQTLVSPTAAEKLWKGGVIPQKVWADLAALIKRPPAKPVVGLAGDPKKTPWSPARAEDFPDLTLDDMFA